MSKRLHSLLIVLIIFIWSFFLTSDLFIRKGLPSSFDGPMHITMISQFYTALKQGEFPVTWADGFANYGMPMPIIHQQTSTYLGALINFITKDAVLSYKLVFLIGAFLSTLFFFYFLVFYFKEEFSLIGAFLFNFAPYRIINIYIRGAQPEFFALVFIPLVLIAIYLIFNSKKSILGLYLLILSSTLLILSHPFVFVISSFIFAIYIVLNIINKRKKSLKKVLLTIFGFFISFLFSAYYLLPLLMEIKYFYYGQTANHLVKDQYLNIKNFVDYHWYYFYKEGEFTRGNFIKVDTPEFVLFLLALTIFIYSIIKKKNNDIILKLSAISGSIFLYFTTSLSDFFYRNINTLSAIQHPWRMLNGFIFVPPLAITYFLNKYFKRQSNYLIVCVIFILTISFLRFPQLYGKNIFSYNQSMFAFTKKNLAATVLNPIWTGNADEYPIKENKGEIIEGDGEIVSEELKNSYRKYNVHANTDVRLADYTFYFPGWRVFVDSKQVDIEFQDPSYRGVITYRVPKGNHNVEVIFGDTKVRFFGKIISITTLLIIMFSYFILKKKT